MGGAVVLSYRSWARYPLDYRTREMQTLAEWSASGTSGSVIGVAGVGKSNLLGYLAHRPEALQQHLDQKSPGLIHVSVDLNNLPTNDISTLYRAILRSFYEFRHLLDLALQQEVEKVYLEHQSAQDPFLPHSGLRELLLRFQSLDIRIVLIFDRFEWFCESAEPAVTDTLRGLRDSFKDILSFIVGMNREVQYLSNPGALGELCELLDSHVCWVGPMNPKDARFLIAVETGSDETAIAQGDLDRLLALTGGHPGLLKALCHRWFQPGAQAKLDPKRLLLIPSINYRIERIWNTLTLDEQDILCSIRRDCVSNRSSWSDAPQSKTTADLQNKGLLVVDNSSWGLRSTLMAEYIDRQEGPLPGLIRLKDDQLFQGRHLLEGLSPLEENLLRFLLKHPREHHTHSALIEAVWPEEVNKEGVSTEALYQTVRGLRRKIEPFPSQPRYVVNWRGTPEGGYQFFAEGRPRLRA